MKIKKIIFISLAVFSLTFCASAESYARTTRTRVTTRTSRPSSTRVVHRTVTYTTHVNRHYYRPHYGYYHIHYHDCHHHHHHGLYCPHGFFFHECPYYHDIDGGLINIDINL